MRLGARLVAVFAAVVLTSIPGLAAAQQQGAFDDGVQTGRQLKDQAQSLPEQQPTPETVPGYQGMPGELGNLFGSTDDALNSAGATATSSDEFVGMRRADANRQRIPTSATDAIKARGEQINADPQAYALGITADGQQGQCQAITRPGQNQFYEATCNVGSAVVASKPSCPITLDHHFSQSYDYTCSDVKLQGTLCIPEWNIGCFPVNYTVSSGCSSFAASGCSEAISSSNTFYTYNGLNYVQGNYSYKCPNQVSYAVTGYPLTLEGQTYMGSAAGPTASPGYINSTQNVSMCAENQLTGCPAGSTLEGTQCVRRQPAALTYVCEDGWARNGTQCEQTITQPAVVDGLACPSNYTLEGDVCLSRVPATPVYSCASGWNLEGTNCTRSSSRPATGEWVCPAGWTVVGSSCTRYVNVPATPGYSCPAGWTVNGSTCELVETTPATGTPQCSAGFTFDGISCVRSWSVAATPAYSCDAGWVLNGALCEQSSSYPATAYDSYCPPSMYLDDTSGLCLYSVFGRTCPRPTFDGATFVRGMLDRESGERLCYYRPIVIYTCPNGGTLSGQVCNLVDTVAANVSFSCSAGTLAGDQCTGTDVEAPTGTGYSCDPGWNFSGSSCTRTSTQSAATSYSCDPGLVLGGGTCTGTLTQPATLGYACGPGETLQGTDCIGSESQPADRSFTCSAGSLQVDQCVESAQPTPAGFDCPVGYSQLQPGFCSQTTAVAAGQHFQCPGSMALAGSDCVSYSNPVSNPSQECTIESEVCSDATPQTRMIEGVAITQACWAWTRTYSCNKVTTGNNDCGDFAGNPQCTFVRDDCLDDPPSGNGSCAVAERVYSCPVPGASGPTQTEMLCGGDVYCVNGNCQQVEREASNELKDALIGLGAMDQAEKEFDPNNLTLFKGTRETCKKPVFGLVNCCAGKTSGLLTMAAGGAALAGGPAVLASVATQFLTLFLCSTQEKMLDVKDRMGLCHYVGTYCSSSFLGICTTKRKTYCCFQSKLTRILQEQGRPQINKPWGAPKTEQCLGFTAEEFSRLDLSVMDFSEIYNEFLEKAKLPDEAQMAGEIQAKIRAYYQQNGGN